MSCALESEKAQLGIGTILNMVVRIQKVKEIKESE
jgi:hypothetical protein